MQVKWNGSGWTDQHGRSVRVKTPFKCKHKGRRLICIMGKDKPTYVDTDSLKEMTITGLVQITHQTCRSCGN